MSTSMIRIAIGTDHAGYPYKSAIIHHLSAKGIEVVDFGTDSEASVDYPDFIRPAAESVAQGTCSLGIVMGGSGNGEAIAANKVRGIRCALCWSEETARLAKEHNNANVISIGVRTVSEELALQMIDVWLDAEYEGGRHEQRITKMEIDPV